MKNSFRAWKVASHSPVQAKILFFFNSWNEGQTLSIDRAMNPQSTATFPANIWTSLASLGLLISRLALYLAGLASIPWSVSRNPKNSPTWTPNEHLFIFSLRSYFRSSWKTSTRLSRWSSWVVDFTTRRQHTPRPDYQGCCWWSCP